MYKKTVASKLEAYVKCAWRDACESPESCPLYPGVAGEEGCGEAGLRAIEEAVAILKETEPVKPEVTEVPGFEPGEKDYIYDCGACHKPIRNVDKFCWFCGREVDWNGR